MNRACANYGIPSSETKYIITKVPEGKGRDTQEEKIFQEIMVKNYQSLIKYFSLQMQRSQ